ncbi:MAG TPA: hypothetical protein DEV85_01900 [Vibrio sp.]|uniref:Type I polyketide synthase n=1 Tax=Vibrio casei TaxID=673372 RepID=A0A368LGW7_9VIBR|nr:MULTISPECIES: type I polyketide synthase [Vibrio]RCS68628.1 type I polyketide synthase [Vibrio casei]SJN30701.1 Malonyl CoA-acyl carrier protein transacylase [Vibrio casei]HCH00630.1 hypothetical protein [Vibrio sp.]
MEQMKMTQTDISTLSDLGAIAVIGMFGEFSGCKNIDEFWSLLQSGKSAGSYTSPDDAEQLGMSTQKTHDENYVPWSMPIEDIDQFDARAFEMTDMQAETMDPQCRRFLQACWSGVEHAGYNPMQLKTLNAGIIACSNPNGYLGETVTAHLDANHHAKALQVLTGNNNDFLATWAAYKLNLTGPALTVQTACSSSLVAIANACLQLQTYQADLMIAGGAALTLPQEVGYVRQQGSILSQNGQCSPFSQDASGTLNGNAVATVVLKRVEDAVEDGDHIWAVIRGAGINNDGRAKMDFMAPGVEGQSAVMNKALQLADLLPEHIQFIETHGTGTQLGDEIEVRALSEVYGDSNSIKYLGAVKSNIGHANAGAGIAGFIKTVLSLYHGKIAPNAGNTDPNSTLNLDAFHFALPQSVLTWPECDVRRAAISSLGFGGTNAHLILEQAPYFPADEQSQQTEAQGANLLTLSGTSKTSLMAQIAAWQAWLTEHKPSQSELRAASNALLWNRHHFSYRTAAVGNNWQELTASLTDGGLKQGASQLVLAFTGQGAQWKGMGRYLYQNDPTFKSVTDQCDEYLDATFGIYSASSVWEGDVDFDQAFSNAGGAHYYQFCYQFALAKTITASGVHYDTVVGHSLGEFAAAVICGVVTLQEAVSLVCQRGWAIEKHCKGDVGMMAVRLDRETLLPLLPESLDLAVVNGEQQCVVAGLNSDLHEFESELKRQSYQSKRLKTTHGFHSRQMMSACEDFRLACEKVEFQPVQGDWISSLTGQKLVSVDADYWVRHLTQEVRFDLVIDSLLDSDIGMIECGGTSVLGDLVQAKLTRRYVTTIFTRDEEHKLLAESHAIAFCCDRLNGESKRYPQANIPGYCFDTNRFWSDQAPHTVRWQSEINSKVVVQDEVEEVADDELTAWLKSLWYAELGEGVTIHDDSDFYALGGNSLAAIQICDQLEKQLDLSFPVSRFLNQRTFGQFMNTLMTLAEEQPEEMENIQ